MNDSKHDHRLATSLAEAARDKAAGRPRSESTTEARRAAWGCRRFGLRKEQRDVRVAGPATKARSETRADRRERGGSTGSRRKRGGAMPKKIRADGKTRGRELFSLALSARKERRSD